MTRLILYALDFVVLMASMLLGVFGAAGFCAFVWGASILDTALGNPPQLTHPAFTTFMIVAIPGMLIGWCGAVGGVILPLHMRLRVPLSRADATTSRLLKAYAAGLVGLVDSD